MKVHRLAVGRWYLPSEGAENTKFEEGDFHRRGEEAQRK
jgi:hypothetical protein